jgi:hypothetical protein
MTASEARLGRWILLYGILQVLSTISVDTAGLKYKDKVRYYVGPSLEGCPPWRSPDAAPLMIEACQQRSYCWVAPQTWGDVRGGQAAQSPPGYSNHQYELTEPVSHQPSPELAATAVAGMHRNPSILHTAMNASTTSASSRGSGTPRAMASSGALRVPALGPVRSPLASPSLMGSPLGSALASPADTKTDYELMMRPTPPSIASSLVPPMRNPRRVSPAPAHRVTSPMSPFSLDGIANTPPMAPVTHDLADSPPMLPVQNGSAERPARRVDSRPPQLGELNFGQEDS